MSFPLGAALAIDAVSALVGVGLAGAFGHMAWRLRAAPYALVALGFLAIAVTYPSETASEASPTGTTPSSAALVRLGGQVGGSLLLLLGYLAARWSPRPWIDIGAAIALAGATLLLGGALDARLLGDVPSEMVLHGAQVLTSASYLGCMLFAFAGFRSRRRWPGTLPAMGFLLLAIAKLAWLVRRVDDVAFLAGAAYAARLVGLLLLLAGVMIPILAIREGRRHAAA